MRCEQCQAAEAVYHLMRMTNDVSETLHLCSDCAERRGLMASLGEPVTDIGALDTSDVVPEVSDLFHSTTCSGCGLTLSALQASWRVGCAECWTAFAAPLRVAVRQIHGATTHVGKPFGGDPQWVPEPADISRMARTRLERELSEAVRLERFEEAALLRDALRGLEP